MDKVEVKVEDSNLDIKKAIVSGYGMDVEGKSEVFLDAAIEVKKTEMQDKGDRKQKALDSHKNLEGAGRNTKTSTIDVDKIKEEEIG